MEKRIRETAFSILLLILVVALIAPPASAQTVPKPTVFFTGVYSFDGSALTFISGATVVIRAQWLDGTVATDPNVDAVISADVSVSGLTLTASDAAGHHFTDGILTISKGSAIFMTCTLTNVVINPVGVAPGTINPGLLVMNMQDLIFGTGLGSTFADEFGLLIAPTNVPDQGALEISLNDFMGGDIQAGIASFGGVSATVDGAPQITTIAFDCFGINKAMIQLKGDSKDKIKIKRGVLTMPEGETFDPASDKVTIIVDGVTTVIPAGSFEKKGEKNDYRYKTGSGTKPRVHARLNFHKAEWAVKIDDVDAGMVDNNDGVKIDLIIGDTEGTETISMRVLTDNNNLNLLYKANPKLSCRDVRPPCIPDDDPDDLKRSCLSFIEVTYKKGCAEEEIITKFSDEIGHPETTFVASDGASVTFHTSCSQCLVCGQIDAGGDFEITGISDATGKMSNKCGVEDASCGSTPPPPTQ